MKAVILWSMLFNLAEFYGSSAGVIMPMGVNVAWNNTESVCEESTYFRSDEVRVCVCVILKVIMLRCTCVLFLQPDWKAQSSDPGSCEVPGKWLSADAPWLSKQTETSHKLTLSVI